MEPKNYFKLTIKMRGKMTQYFETRDASTMRESMHLEHAVDDEIVRVAVIDDEIRQFVAENHPSLMKRIEKEMEKKAKATQGNLFAEEGGRR